MVIVTGDSTDRCLMADHVTPSGVHVCAAACSGVSFGSSFDGATASGSISPICSRSPGDFTRIDEDRPANVTSINQLLALASESRQRNVGGVISGGKIVPSSG